MMESKDIKDYLHLYLGQQCKGVEGTMIYTIATVHKSGNGSVLLDDIGNVCLINDFKLILRPLSDMTTHEDFEIFPKLSSSKWGPYSPDEFVKLLSLGFDLFGLIDAGLAIKK